MLYRRYLLNIAQLECFINLSYTLNFTQTAEELYLTQSAISRSILSLENELGVKLFIRNKREVKLTDAGKLFKRDAQDILERTNTAIERSRKAAIVDEDTLRIGFTETILEREVFPSLINEFHLKNPSIKIHLEHGSYSEVRNRLIDNQYDLAFLSEDGMVHMPDYDFYELVKGSLVAIVPESNVLSDKELITIENLQEETILFLNHIQIPSILKKLQDEIRSLSIDCKFYYSDTVGVSIILAESQLGIAIVPSFLVSNRINCAKIIPFQNDTSMVYGIAAKKNAYNKVKNIVSLAQKYFIKPIL